MENESEDGGVETGGGNGCEMGTVTKKKGTQKLMTCIVASLSPGFRDRGEQQHLNKNL